MCWKEKSHQLSHFGPINQTDQNGRKPLIWRLLVSWLIMRPRSVNVMPVSKIQLKDWCPLRLSPYKAFGRLNWKLISKPLWALTYSTNRLMESWKLASSPDSSFRSRLLEPGLNADESWVWTPCLPILNLRPLIPWVPEDMAWRL